MSEGLMDGGWQGAQDFGVDAGYDPGYVDGYVDTQTSGEASLSWVSDLLSGVDIASDGLFEASKNTSGEDSLDAMSKIMAGEGVTPATSSAGSWIDKLLSGIGGIKADTWANLAGKALSGYASGQVEQQKQQNIEKDYQLRKDKQDNAMTSAEKLKTPGLMQTYKSMFLKGDA